MKTSLRAGGIVAVLGSIWFSVGVAHAAPIIAGVDNNPSIAVQNIDLFPGTPFNPTGSTITITLSARGSFTQTRDAQTGNTINWGLSADFKGTLPAPLPAIPFDIVAGSLGLPASTGTIDNVVQNPLDPGFGTGQPSSFVTGDVTVNTFFALVAAGGAVVLYSDPADAAVFTGVQHGLPGRPGDVFSSPDRVNIYLETGPGFDTSRDLLIGQSFNRTVTITPEPSTLALAFSAAAIFGVVALRRRAANRPLEA